MSNAELIADTVRTVACMAAVVLIVWAVARS